MQIVIDIPEHCFKELRHIELNESNEGVVFHAIKCIVDGTPLSKGHGRLIDENELNDEIVCEKIDGMYYDVIYAHSFYDASTIIEADKESEDKKRGYIQVITTDLEN